MGGQIRGFAGAILVAAAMMATMEGEVAGEPVQVAQGFFTPPAPVPAATPEPDDDRAEILLRVERLEADLRRANGAIEELQNQNERLADQLKRFQEDVEFRLSGDKSAVAAPAAPTTPAPAPAPRKSDAFDPNSKPNAPGAPQQLGTTPPSAPLDLSARVGETPPAAAPPKPAETGPTVIGSGLDFADGPRSQFNAAVDAYKAGQYQDAENGFKAFLTSNVGHRLAPDAIFYLGETYLQRSRPREAAEQYLRLSTDFARSTKAPEGMMRLGQSLAMLGNSEQACATFSELGRRYPNASGALKKSVEREMQKDHC